MQQNLDPLLRSGPCTWEAEVGGLKKVWGHPGLCGRFQASLDFSMRLSLRIPPTIRQFHPCYFILLGIYDIIDSVKTCFCFYKSIVQQRDSTFGLSDLHLSCHNKALLFSLTIMVTLDQTLHVTECYRREHTHIYMFYNYTWILRQLCTVRTLNLPLSRK